MTVSLRWLNVVLEEDCIAQVTWIASKMRLIASVIVEALVEEYKFCRKSIFYGTSIAHRGFTLGNGVLKGYMGNN